MFQVRITSSGWWKTWNRMSVAESGVENSTGFLVGKICLFSELLSYQSVPSIGTLGINYLHLSIVFYLTSLHRKFHKSKLPCTQCSPAMKFHERCSTNNWMKDSSSLGLSMFSITGQSGAHGRYESLLIDWFHPLPWENWYNCSPSILDGKNAF